MTTDEAFVKASMAFLPDQYRKAIIALSEEPMSCYELADRLETSIEYSRKILHKLQKAKVACIVHWRRSRGNGMPTKMWGLGTKDERPPQKLTRAQISKRHRETRKGLSGEVRLGVWGL